MRVIDRLVEYLKYKKISNYQFEKTIQISNGYLSKQMKGKGSIGSDILTKVYANYNDLDHIWLLTGNGDMIFSERIITEIEIKNHIRQIDLLIIQHFQLLRTALSNEPKFTELVTGNKKDKNECHM